jgi:type IV secretory pathway VirB9-like protein
MTIIASHIQRRLLAASLVGFCFSFAFGNVADAKKAPGAPIESAAIAGDPMSPVNPFNGGTDAETMPGDVRIAVFPYSRDQIFKVLTAPLKLTTIELEKGEVLTSDPAMGDSIQWEIVDDKSNHIFIKPHKPGLVNTLHITTNKREYDFTLISSPAGGFFYQQVRFNYPHAPMLRTGVAQGSGLDADRHADSGSIDVSPDKLNWDYTIDGRAEFTPEVVFDDGHSVWMRMPPKAQSWPVPFYKEHGDEVVGNFIRRGDFLVLQRLADQIILRSGDQEVTVKRGGRRFLGVF